MTKNIDLDVAKLLDKLVIDLTPLLSANPIVIGIHSGGSWLAEILHQKGAVLCLALNFLAIDGQRCGFCAFGHRWSFLSSRRAARNRSTPRHSTEAML